jgi:hypothetical protein
MEKREFDAKRAKLAMLATKWRPWPFVDRYIGAIAEDEALTQEIKAREEYCIVLTIELEKIRKKIAKLKAELEHAKEEEQRLKLANGF